MKRFRTMNKVLICFTLFALTNAEEHEKSNSKYYEEIILNLQTVRDFYGDLVTTREQVKKALEYDPDPVKDKVLLLSSNLKKIIEKLEAYLEKVNKGNVDSDEDFQTFMKQANSDYDKVNAKAKKLEKKIKKKPLHKAMQQSRENVVRSLESITRKTHTVDESIKFLKDAGIFPSDKPTQPAASSHLDSLVFSDLIQQYEKLLRLPDPENSLELVGIQGQIQKLIERNEESLKSYVSIVHAITQEIMAEAKKSDERTERLAEQTVERLTTLMESNKRVQELMNEVFEHRDDVRHKEYMPNHDEL